MTEHEFKQRVEQRYKDAIADAHFGMIGDQYRGTWYTVKVELHGGKMAKVCGDSLQRVYDELTEKLGEP